MTQHARTGAGMFDFHAALLRAQADIAQAEVVGVSREQALAKEPLTAGRWWDAVQADLEAYRLETAKVFLQAFYDERAVDRWADDGGRMFE
jgi:hypothetical protein